MLNALKINNLSKTYTNGFHALKGIDLSIAEGDFFALLGSNGAGKTTAIGIICGLLNKTGGDIQVLGLDQSTHINKVKRLIGLMPQEFNFNPFEPIEEILTNQAGYYGIPRAEAKKNIEVLLKKMQLWDRRSDIAKSLSGGMKRRLMLARALVHQPKILILDEPTAGVDVEIRRSMWAYLEELNQAGMTIILTTHYLEEAESLCKNIAILNEGRVVEQTSMKALLARVSQQTLILESVQILPERPLMLNFETQRLDDYSMKIVLESNTDITEALNDLSKQGICVNHIRSSQNRLETLFLHLTNNG
ncbi:MAG: ABC transporter ATP-binding protein [Gammaproteobacteria bacterium]|nr:ABC transporter ATP-binding protein [Gammaproteobacteria bacterium]